MKEVAAQHATMEAELQKVSRDSTRRKRALQEVRANMASSPALSSDTVAVVEEGLAQLAIAADGSSTPAGPQSPLKSPTSSITDGARARSMSGSLSPTRAGRLRSSTVHTLNPKELERVVDSALAGEEGEESDNSDDDDEFFEAVEAGQIPVEDEPVKTVPSAEAFKDIDITPYKGYENLRSKLPVAEDNRPPVSLWAILKGSIGKDLTKISFPVFFNEPCSMLQRMAEDIEFSECRELRPLSPLVGASADSVSSLHSRRRCGRSRLKQADRLRRRLRRFQLLLHHRSHRQTFQPDAGQ